MKKQSARKTENPKRSKRPAKNPADSKSRKGSRGSRGPNGPKGSRGAQSTRTKKVTRTPKSSKKAKTPARKRPRKSAPQHGDEVRVRPPDPDALLHLEERLRERIHGKDAAVERIAQTIRVRMTHLDFRPERPNGAFLIIGPSGVGKNEFAYALAKTLYGDESLVVNVDMRAFATEEEVNRLTDTIVPGPQPILFEGLLSVPLRRRPHSILLMRGIEHAHPAAHRLLQQIIEQGWLEDARGRLSFEHTILIATSRIPEDENGTASEIGFNRAAKTSDERILGKLARRLGEEFLEVFHAVVVVPPLSPEDVRKIARYKVDVVLERLEETQRGIQVSDSVFRTFITDEECERSGAGRINNTLESKLLNPLARYILAHPKERRIRVDVRNGDLVIEPIVAGAPGAGRGSLRLRG